MSSGRLQHHHLPRLRTRSSVLGISGRLLSRQRDWGFIVGAHTRLDKHQTRRACCWGMVSTCPATMAQRLSAQPVWPVRLR
eukprot:8782752-Alexandrium_andersonii.AAC.1